jgi:hypothetical protein
LRHFQDRFFFFLFFLRQCPARDPRRDQQSSRTEEHPTQIHGFPLSFCLSVVRRVRFLRPWLGLQVNAHMMLYQTLPEHYEGISVSPLW